VGIGVGDGGEGVVPFYSGGEAVANVSAFLEGFGRYGEEKRWRAAPFRVEERRWLGGLVPIQ
jgi:hypothetical protein